MPEVVGCGCAVVHADILSLETIVLPLPLHMFMCVCVACVLDCVHGQGKAEAEALASLKAALPHSEEDSCAAVEA